MIFFRKVYIYINKHCYYTRKLPTILKKQCAQVQYSTSDTDTIVNVTSNGNTFFQEK